MKLQFTICFILLSFAINAQTYVDIPWREGTIIKKGKEIEGMIRLGGDLGAPWLNNSKVYFVTLKDYGDGRKVKKKVIKEYKPEELDGYSTFTMDRGGNRIEMNFETYEIIVMGAIRKKKGKAFLRLLEKGAVNVYSYNQAPTKKLVTTAEERREDRASALRQEKMYVKKEKDDLIAAVDFDLIKELNNCPEIVEKIKNEDYGFKPLEERPKRKGLGKFIADSAGDNGLEAKILNALIDYNKCVK